MLGITIDDMLEMFIFPEDVIFSVYDMADSIQDNIVDRKTRGEVEDWILKLEVISIDNIYESNIEYGVVFNVETLREEDL